MEKLRNEADGPPNLDTVNLNIQRESSRIHAAFFFEHIGKAVLQKLCLLLSSTATGKFYNGWQEFAAHIGLTIEQIHVRLLKILINVYSKHRIMFYSRINNIGLHIHIITITIM